MGLFGRKKFEKNVTRNYNFLKDFATKLHALMRYTEGNEKVTQALRKLQEDFEFTLGTHIQDAKNVPLSADKCMVERDKALDILDEIIARLPSELKQSRANAEQTAAAAAGTDTGYTAQGVFLWTDKRFGYNHDGLMAMVDAAIDGYVPIE